MPLKNKNRKVLVTGAAGFIGSHLTELLVEEGYQVKAFVHYNSQGNRGWMEHSKYKDDVEFVSGDIRDYDGVYEALKGCEKVFHLAALIGIPYSYRSPLAYIRTNIEGTYNVLEASRQLDLKEVIVTSTSETYGTAQYVPIDEKHPVLGQSPYAATKIAADQLALSYYRSFETPVKIVRPFNTYGPRQSARAIIPTIITQILSGKKEIKLGNIYPTRDFTFVKDTVRGILAITHSVKLFGESTNIGVNEEITVKDLVHLVSKLMNKKVAVEGEKIRIRPELSEVERLWCDNSKILKMTDWRPEYNLKNGLQETIAFIEKHLSIYKTEIYNV